MGKNKSIVIETGLFASPATQTDSPYELSQDSNGELEVKCLTSGGTYEVSVLAVPTKADIESQKRAFIRELAAWLCTNGPQNFPREQLAVTEVSEMLNAEYSAADLADDRQWIQSNDLSKRIKLLKEGLPEEERLGLVQFAARVGAAGTGISESDAQFIEILGVGLGLTKEVVTDAVLSAIQSPNAA